MKRKHQAQHTGGKWKKPHHDNAAKQSSKAFDLKHSKSVREQAEPYRLATVKFPIDALSAIWSVGANRPINESHKRRLGAIFREQGLRRSDINNRLRVACSKEDVEKMKDAMGPGNVEADALFPLEDVSTKEHAWPYFKDWMEVVGKEAELMAGNHRVEALKEMLSRSGGGDDERWWLCDLYDKGSSLQPQPLRIAIRN